MKNTVNKDMWPKTHLKMKIHELIGDMFVIVYAVVVIGGLVLLFYSQAKLE